MRAHFQQRFWNPETGRFGTIDLYGNLHDYGFTFLNNEAVVFGIASPEQAKSICDWVGGRRTVAGDTSVGDDIYHWRFGPRSTTRRNLEYYFWGWSNPESIASGALVQDGGAVLGWTYYDLMAQLKTAGPDVASRGYRKSPSGSTIRSAKEDIGRTTAKMLPAARCKSHTAGGLGLDKEFIESVMATQVVLYGFLGFRPTYDDSEISPQLPKDWPELTVTRIYLHDQVLNIAPTLPGDAHQRRGTEQGAGG